MPAVTPYQQNDYQAVNNFRPHQLQINDIFKALSAQNQFWEDGARRVKSVYDNALNLKLSLEPNREIRKRFMEEAEKQLTKLSSMDLSDPSVQRQGFDIFKPLFQDIGVMSDDQSTRWIDDVQSNIQRARENNNGKDYADSNAMVAMEGVYEFKTSKDRFAGKGYLANKKSFTPYYDPSKEMMEITKNCKGPTISSTMPGENASDMYLFTQESSGASPTRLKGCLTAALSQRAKDQIGIDGYASYMTQNRKDHPDGKNYGALRDDYMSYNKGAMDGITQEIGDLDGKIVAFQNAYNKSKDPRYLDMKKAAEEAKNQYLEQGKNLTNAFNQVAAGNLDFIKKNYGELSERLYTSKQLGSFSEAFRNDNTVDKYSADAVRLQQQRLVYDEAKTQQMFENAKELEDIRFKNDLKLEQLKGLKGKKLDANGNVVEDLIPTNPAFTSDDVSSTGFKEFQDERNQTTTAIDGVNSELFNTLKRKYPKEMEQYNDPASFFKPGPNGISPALSFLDANGRIQDDEAVQDWSNQSALLTNKLGILNEQQAANELEASQRETKLNTSRTLNVGGIPLSEKEIADALGGTSSGPLTSRKIAKTEQQDIGDGKSQIISYDVTELLYNGKVIASQDSGQNWSDVRSTIQKVSGISRTNASMRNNIYGRSMLTIRPDVYATVNNTDKEDPTRNNIKAALGEQFQLDDITIIKKDPTTGIATISIKGNSKVNMSSDDVKKRLTQLSSTDEAPKFNEASNEAVVTFQSPYLVDQRTISNPLAPLQMHIDKLNLSLNNPLSPYAKVQPGQLIRSIPITTKAYKGTDFQVDIIKTQGGAKYEVLSKQKNDVVSADGTITQKKGMYYRTGQVFTDSNKLLEYLNGTTQNIK